MEPKRIQRKRSKGWKMPPNTVSVTRPGPYGNPFVIGEPAPSIYSRFHRGTVETAEQAVALFRRVLIYEAAKETPAAERTLDLLAGLRGKNLACFCPLVDQHGNAVPCHADVLLELANAPVSP